MRSQTHWQVSALCLMASGAFVGCSKQQSEPVPVVAVQVAVAQSRSLEQVVTAEAILFPKNQAAITPKIAAPVRRFYVNRGSRVRQGQLLAVLENRDLAAAVVENKGGFEQAQAAYETTTKASLPEELSKAELDAKAAHEGLDAQQKLYDSRKALFDQGALPRKDLDQAGVALVQARTQSLLADQHQASMRNVGKQQTAKSAAGQLTSAQGKYEGAAAQLRYTEIRSPINGVVTDRPVWPGETPPQGTPLLTVMDTSIVIARAHIPQEQAALLKVGDLATISPDEGEGVPGKVTLVSPALDTGGTTVEVWIEAGNKDSVLRPGTTVQVRMTARKIENATTIPVAALLEAPGGAATVMVVSADGRAHQTEVAVGIRSGGLVQITKGLEAGQKVVTTGAYGLPDDTQVMTGTEQPDASPKAPAARK